MNTFSNTSNHTNRLQHTQANHERIDRGQRSTTSTPLHAENQYEDAALHSGIRMSVILSEYAEQRVKTRELSVA